MINIKESKNIYFENLIFQDNKIEDNIITVKLGNGIIFMNFLLKNMELNKLAQIQGSEVVIDLFEINNCICKFY